MVALRLKRIIMVADLYKRRIIGSVPDLIWPIVDVSPPGMKHYHMDV